MSLVENSLVTGPKSLEQWMIQFNSIRELKLSYLKQTSQPAIVVQLTCQLGN